MSTNLYQWTSDPSQLNNRDSSDLNNHELMNIHKAIFLNASIAIVSVSNDLIVKTVNPAFERMMGYTYDEIVGKISPYRFHDMDELKGRYKETFGKELTDESDIIELLKEKLFLRSSEWTWVKKDGTRFPVNINHTTLFGIDDEILGYMGMVTDISQQKEAENELIQRTGELEGFFAVALDLLCIADSSGYFRKVSKEWERVFGYTTTEFTSNPFISFLHPDDIEPTKKILQQLNENNEITRFVNRYRTKTGEYRYLEWNSVPYQNRYYSAARDITDKLNLQQSLEQTIHHEKELNELKNRFITMASHELRTPLTSIMMSTENLRSYWKRMNPVQIDSKLNNVQNQISHLITLLNDVLQVSRIKEGKLQPAMELIELVSLCTSVADTFRGELDHNGQLSVESSVAKMYVQADIQLIRQVLYNLISNAIKYSRPNPQVSVKLSLMNTKIEISISDNGIGIPPEDQNKLFQPFFRASNTRTIEGNGLGLNIAKEALLLHGGDIRFESVQNKGTTFFLYLPYNPKENESKK